MNNNIIMSSKSIDPVNAFEESNLFTFQVQVKKEVLVGMTYEDVINALTSHIATRLLVAPSKKTPYSAGYYNIDVNAKIKEVIVGGDSMMLITDGDPFIKSTKETRSKYSIYIDKDTFYGPEED